MRFPEKLKQVEKIGECLLIAEDGHPVVRIMPCDESSTEKYTKKLLAMLRSNVRHYDAPEEPVGEILLDYRCNVDDGYAHP